MPNAPSGVIVVANPGEIDLSWCENDISCVRMEVVRDGASVQCIMYSPATNQYSWQDHGVAPGTRYTYVIKADDSSGGSASSNPRVVVAK